MRNGAFKSHLKTFLIILVSSNSLYSTEGYHTHPPPLVAVKSATLPLEGQFLIY